MKLKIENFGPIKKGEIDLSKRFYLLVGYNNTGKTYLSKLLFHVFEEKTISGFINSDFGKEIEAHLEISIDSHEFFLTKNLINTVLVQFALYIKEVVIESFNVEKNHFSFESFSPSFEYEWEKVVENDYMSINRTESFQANSFINVTSIYKPKNSEKMKYSTIRYERKEETEDVFEKGIKDDFFKQANTGTIEKERFIEVIINLLFYQIVKNKPTYIPANRIYILENYEYVFRREKERREEFSKELLKIPETEIDTKKIHALRKAMKSNYTEPINQLLNEIYRISENNRHKEKLTFYDHILQKLATLMGGKIVTNKERFNGNDKYYFQVKNKRKQEDLPFYLASSSVNQLSILYLYFEYFVKEKNNFLILDEPEENLHPETQISLMNLLFEFANMNGNKVLMTTHSPLLADVVNNYYYLAYLKQEKVEIPKGIEKYPFDTAIDFLPKDLGVYFFGKGKMQEYAFDKYGASFFDFDKEIRKIKDMGKLLTDAIFQHENQEE